jgi:hypothetical protein
MYYPREFPAPYKPVTIKRLLNGDLKACEIATAPGR